MSQIARSGNVRGIRPGVAIPTQRPEDSTATVNARIAALWSEKAHQLAQTAPNSEDHLMALHMAGIAEKLPRNNLRLLVTPVTPRREWFDEAWSKWRVAQKAHELADSRWNLASCLDQQDGGNRRKEAQAERQRTRAALDLAIEDALRTPTTRKTDAARKQEMIGRREWAQKYRLEWQAMVDEDLARYPAKSRRAKTEALA